MKELSNVLTSQFFKKKGFGNREKSAHGFVFRDEEHLK